MHWQTPPTSDPRTWLPLTARGQRAPGHTGTPAACPRCAAELAAARVDPPSLGADGDTSRAPPPIDPPAPATRRPSTPPAHGPKPGVTYTSRQLILLAAGKVAATREGLVPLGALVVAAWQLDPARFGLDLDGDRTRHPSSIHVAPKLSGEGGLCALGWMAFAGQNVWRLTSKGARKLRALGAVPLEEAPPA